MLLPNEVAGRPAFDLLVKEVVREMTALSDQKSTEIRRVFVAEALYDAAADALLARLAKATVDNPRNEKVRMGALVNRTQLAALKQGLAHLSAQAEVLHDGSDALIDADAVIACCVSPTLLGKRDAAGSDSADRGHDTGVFGPVATLVPYRETKHALALVRRGEGSLVTSLYGSDAGTLIATALEPADSHGRVHVISPDMAALQTRYGNVMPQSLHGGPDRAGGGEVPGGLRALNFYHRRSAVQADTEVLAHLHPSAAL